MRSFFYAKIISMGKKGLIFYITLFLLILAFSTAATHFDFDLWARLIAGMGVIDGGHVLKQDFLSYTPVHTWWDHDILFFPEIFWSLQSYNPPGFTYVRNIVYCITRY